MKLLPAQAVSFCRSSLKPKHLLPREWSIINCVLPGSSTHAQKLNCCTGVGKLLESQLMKQFLLVRERLPFCVKAEWDRFDISQPVYLNILWDVSCCLGSITTTAFVSRRTIQRLYRIYVQHLWVNRNWIGPMSGPYIFCPTTIIGKSPKISMSVF